MEYKKLLVQERDTQECTLGVINSGATEGVFILAQLTMVMSSVREPPGHRLPGILKLNAWCAEHEEFMVLKLLGSRTDLSQEALVSKAQN